MELKQDRPVTAGTAAASAIRVGEHLPARAGASTTAGADRAATAR